MNKTAIVLGYIALIIFGLAGAVVILIFKPDSFGVLTAFILTVLSLASTFTVLIYGLGKQGEKLDEIKAQTNGTLSALHEKLAQKDATIEQQQAQLLAVVGNSPSSAQE